MVDLHGAQVRPFLRQLVANSVDKLQKPGKALYTCMLNAITALDFGRNRSFTPSLFGVKALGISSIEE